ncbi:MAG TPA: hypothetical protein VGO86_05215 [Candidatus Dormibacteraeota bacterium]
MRIRVDPRHRSPEQMDLVRRRLDANPDVDSVTVDLRTGSILVLGSSTERLRAALDTVVDIVEEAGPEGLPEAGVVVAVDLVRDLDRRLAAATAGRVSLRWLVPAAFLTIGVRQLIRQGLTAGQIPWFVLIYYGVDSFLKLNPEYAPATRAHTHGDRA